jgi:hypothetical protein
MLLKWSMALSIGTHREWRPSCMCCKPFVRTLAYANIFAAVRHTSNHIYTVQLCLNNRLLRTKRYHTLLLALVGRGLGAALGLMGGWWGISLLGLGLGFCFCFLPGTM